MELILNGNYPSKSVMRFAGDFRNGAESISFTGDDLDLLTNNEMVYVEIWEDETHQYIKVSEVN